MPTVGVVVITHRRPDRQSTLRALRRHGYTGPVVLLVDDEDPTLPEYRRLHGGLVRVFPMAEYRRRTDLVSNAATRGVSAARIAAHDAAAAEGWTHAVVSDDDHGRFDWRMDAAGRAAKTGARNLDGILDAMARFLDESGAAAIGLMRGGEFMSGAATAVDRALDMSRNRPRIACFYMVRTDRPLDYAGRMGEDTLASLRAGRAGRLVLNIGAVSVESAPIGANRGGCEDDYRRLQYEGMFTLVLDSPSCNSIQLARNGGRLVNRTDWRYAVPKIVREDAWRGGAGRSARS